jgi:putative ABC transport system permease protein
MLLDETIRVALQAIRANKLRSLLTALGIIIGVGAVITMIALGTGAKKAVQDRIQALGPTLLTLFAGQSFRGGVAQNNRVSLTMDDDTALANQARYLTAVVPELANNLQVQFGSQNANLNITGTTPNYVPVHTYALPAGRMFTTGENEARRRYAVLGSSVPTIFNANPAAMIGQEIQIKGIPFEIIGILSEKGSQGFFNPDEQILIPLETARYRIMGTDRLRSITAQVDNLQNMTLAMIEIERVLRRMHKIRSGGENDFQIRNQTDVLGTFQATTQTFGFLLAGIAAVSLIVGGIGIMNIMLVSVTERTKEIGVRKSIGARSRDVLRQFLTEAVFISEAGGILGIVLGIIAGDLLAAWLKVDVIFPYGWAIAGLLVCSAIGIGFGLYPAYRAANLDPIEALRYE